MYTNKKGFSLIDLIVKIVLVALFILLLIWLFRNYSPNMKPFYSNIFRENASYMSESGKKFFTTDKLPEAIGETRKLTLKSMEEMNLLIPFVDKDGNACDNEKSYVEVTREEEGYTLKTNLVCGSESNFVIEKLGCYDYGCGACSNNTPKTAMEYEFKREISKTVKLLSCPDGYSKSGDYCTKQTGTETIKATANYTKPFVTITNALYKNTPSTTIEVKANCTTTNTTVKEYKDAIKTTSTTTVKEYKDAVKTTSTTTVKEYKDATDKVTTTCKDVKVKDPNCSVQCTTKFINGEYVPVCNTCGYITRKQCTDSTTKVCPSDYPNQEGSGSTLKCYKNVQKTTTTYSCPSDYPEKEGSGSTLKCYKNVPKTTTTYSCPSGYPNQEGSGSTLKCYKNVTKTNTNCVCSSTSTSNNGKTGTELRCFRTIEGTKVPYCADSSAIYNEKTGKCELTVGEKFDHYSCPATYTLKNDVCVKPIIDKVKATIKTSTVKGFETKWSRSKTLEGWTATGKTRVVNIK